MFQENEVLTLVLAIGVLLFVLVYKRGLRFPQRPVLLLSAFIIACGGWFFTVVEGYCTTGFCNLAEHICYVVSSIVLVIWFWLVFNPRLQPQK